MPNPSRRVLARSAPGSRPAAAPSVRRPAPVDAGPPRAATLHRNVRGLGAQRRDKDLYETPAALATAICRRLARVLRLDEAPRIIEPSAGSGSFVRAARATWPRATILAVDLHQQNARAMHAAGATSYTVGQWQQQDVGGFGAHLILGNPPYSEAEAHIQHALDHVLGPDGYLAFLLPTSFLASQGRCSRLWPPREPGGLIGLGCLRYIWPIAERPSFTGNSSTDMTEYACYVWRKGWGLSPEVLPPLWWRPENAEHHDA